MITQDVRRAIARALADEGFAPADPGLRPGGRPGCYASSVAFRLADGADGADGRTPRDIARLLAARLSAHPWLARAEVSGPGFVAVTVTPQALAALPARIAAAGPGCARSDVLRGVTLAAPPAACLRTARSWEQARAALAAELTVRLAAAAGATVTVPCDPERSGPAPRRSPSPAGTGARDRSEGKQAVAPAAEAPRAAGVAAAAPSRGKLHAGEPGFADVVAAPSRGGPRAGEPGFADVAAAIAFAGPDAVRFSLARAAPGRPVRIDAARIARQLPDNPAYAVRYAHARAASGVRWAATQAAEAVPRRLPADPGELALLDALSWLPERVAVAARRGRPDEFARYLEKLASVTIATLSSARQPGSTGAPGSGRLGLAAAAETGLAAGLGLLGVSAPDRL